MIPERVSLKMNLRPGVGHMNQLFAVRKILMRWHRPQIYWTEAKYQHHPEKHYGLSLSIHPDWKPPDLRCARREDACVSTTGTWCQTTRIYLKAPSQETMPVAVSLRNTNEAIALYDRTWPQRVPFNAWCSHSRPPIRICFLKTSEPLAGGFLITNLNRISRRPIYFQETCLRPSHALNLRCYDHPDGQKANRVKAKTVRDCICSIPVNFRPAAISSCLLRLSERSAGRVRLLNRPPHLYIAILM
jgi:hypothetical protein